MLQIKMLEFKQNFFKMLNKLRQFLFRQNVQKYLADYPREKVFVNYNRARTVLLLFESHYSEKNTETRKIIESLTADAKKVVAIGYVQKRKIISPIYPEFRIMYPGDTDLFEKPKKNIIDEVRNQEFDLLIDITRQDWLPLSYIVLFANAKCKTGMKKKNVDLYDFVVDIDNYLIDNEVQIEDLPFSLLYEQINFYLKNIQTTDY